MRLEPHVVGRIIIYITSIPLPMLHNTRLYIIHTILSRIYVYSVMLRLWSSNVLLSGDTSPLKRVARSTVLVLASCDPIHHGKVSRCSLARMLMQKVGSNLNSPGSFMIAKAASPK